MRAKKGLKAAEAFAEGKIEKSIEKKVRNVVKSFQKEYDLEQTGKVDDQLIAKLDEVAK